MDQLVQERELFLSVQRDVERLYEDVVSMQQQNVEETEELKQEFLHRLCEQSRRLNSISFIPEVKEMRKAIKAAIKVATN